MHRCATWGPSIALLMGRRGRPLPLSDRHHAQTPSDPDDHSIEHRTEPRPTMVTELPLFEPTSRHRAPRLHWVNEPVGGRFHPWPTSI